jgi:superkiller protein 3
MQIDDDKPPPLAELEAAVQRSPGDPAAWQRLADGYAVADRFEASVEILEHALRLAPHDPDAHSALGHMLRVVDRARDAIRHMQEAARLDRDPDQGARRTFDLAASFDEAGEHATAVDLFRKVLELDPRERVAWIRLAFALSDHGRFAEAIPAFENATAYRPKSARLWAGLSRAYEQTGQHAKAVQAFVVAIRLDPTSQTVASSASRFAPAPAQKSPEPVDRDHGPQEPSRRGD